MNGRRLEESNDSSRSRGSKICFPNLLFLEVIDLMDFLKPLDPRGGAPAAASITGKHASISKRKTIPMDPENFFKRDRS